MSSTIWKGRLAEAETMTSLIAQGYEPYLPVFGNGPCDLVAIHPTYRQVIRIEVKFTSSQRRPSRWDVSLKQTRPNRTGVVTKMFNSFQCDVLAVYVEPLDRVLYFDASSLEGRNSMVVKDDPERYLVPILEQG